MNGGSYATRPDQLLLYQGDATGLFIGNGIILGQRGLNGTSAGFATNGFITSIASLGAFQAGDTISVQFAGSWMTGSFSPRPELGSLTRSTSTMALCSGDLLGGGNCNRSRGLRDSHRLPVAKGQRHRIRRPHRSDLQQPDVLRRGKQTTAPTTAAWSVFLEPNVVSGQLCDGRRRCAGAISGAHRRQRSHLVARSSDRPTCWRKPRSC